MKPELLYLTPVIPSVTGNGLAMRAGMMLEALAAEYSVSLLVIKLYASADQAVPEAFVRMCRRTAVTELAVTPGRPWTELMRWWNRSAMESTLKEYETVSYDRIHVFRLAMTPFAQRFFASSPRAERRLDLDEVESSTRRRIAQLARRNGDVAIAATEEAAALRSSELEGEALHWFGQIYVCSASEKETLATRIPVCRIGIVPNAVRIPVPLPSAPADRPFSFLFAGTLGYYPNEDAVLYLCREIVPRLRQRASRDFEVALVGAGANRRTRDAIFSAGMTLVGPVPDMRPYYERASAVLVPLRAGGGTRIKILEAWSFGRPVVTTALGIEGLQGQDGRHALVADSADGFTDACVRLMEAPALAAGITHYGYELVTQAYSPEAFRKAIEFGDSHAL